MRWLIYTAYIPALIWMYIIAGFSGAVGEESSGLSLAVTESIVEGIDMITYEETYSEEERIELVEMLHTPVRKLAHMTEYAVLYILVAIPMMCTLRNVGRRRIIVIALFVCVIYAAFDEIHQLFVEGREGKVTDVIIDTAGSLFGLAFICCINKLANCKIVGKSKQ